MLGRRKSIHIIKASVGGPPKNLVKVTKWIASAVNTTKISETYSEIAIRTDSEYRSLYLKLS